MQRYEIIEPQVLYKTMYWQSCQPFLYDVSDDNTTWSYYHDRLFSFPLCEDGTVQFSVLDVPIKPTLDDILVPAIDTETLQIEMRPFSDFVEYTLQKGVRLFEPFATIKVLHGKDKSWKLVKRNTEKWHDTFERKRGGRIHKYKEHTQRGTKFRKRQWVFSTGLAYVHIKVVEFNRHVPILEGIQITADPRALAPDKGTNPKWMTCVRYRHQRFFDGFAVWEWDLQKGQVRLPFLHQGQQIMTPIDITYKSIAEIVGYSRKGLKYRDTHTHRAEVNVLRDSLEWQATQLKSPKYRAELKKLLWLES